MFEIIVDNYRLYSKLDLYLRIKNDKQCYIVYRNSPSVID